MPKLTMTDATLEMTVPLEVDSVNPPGIKLRGTAYVDDAVITCNGKTIRLPKLYVSCIWAEMIPTVVGDRVVLFTTDEESAPDAVVGE